jgi:hypothetical protein
VTDTTKRLDDKKAKNVGLKKVEVDFAKIVKVHDKLSRGELIDPAAVSNLEACWTNLKENENDLPVFLRLPGTSSNLQ